MRQRAGSRTMSAGGHLVAPAPDRDPGPDALARGLARGPAGPDAGPVEWIQTHISHVFLVGPRVYKLRKAVRLPFLDFSTLEARNADCLREVALNRRLAPSVYLGVAALSGGADRARIGPVRETLSDPGQEHVVVMRRLPAGRDALSLLERGELGHAELDAIAGRLQRFHDAHTLGRPAPWSTADWLARTAGPVLESLAELASSGLVPDARVASIEARTRALLGRLAPAIEQRRREGRAVDGHGDVHLDHVWLEVGASEPLLIDCLEFDDDLRRIDRASEVAFLAMDLRYRERPGLAEWFLATYATHTDDHGLFAVVDLHAAYRALVRAKVAALAARQSSIDAAQRARARSSGERHLQLAESLLAPRDRAGLVLMCGTVGSGKSSVARALAHQGRGIPIASDRVRKHLAGLDPSQGAAAAPDQGIYRPGWTDRVYAGLLERAAPVVDSGRTAILDASFAQRAQREAARAWAAQRGIPVRLVESRCPTPIARERLEARSRRGGDPSDADAAFLPVSQARFEPPDEWPAADRHVVRTDAQDWEQRLPDDVPGWPGAREV